MIPININPIKIIIVLALALITLIIMPPLSMAKTNESPLYFPHAPIRINNDSDFIPSNGIVGGSGKWNDPYIIEGWEINSTNYECAIYVGNTTSHLIIKNNYLHYYINESEQDPSSNSNIFLYHVVNVEINNNILLGPTSVKLYYSDNNSIINNKLEGITLYSSNYNNIIANFPIRNSNHIFLDSSNYNNITKNNVTGHLKSGLYLILSTHNNIIENYINNNLGGGIYLRESSNFNNIIKNIIKSNLKFGVMIEDSSDNDLSKNNLSDNSIIIRGDLLPYWTTHNIDSSNIVNNKPIYYYKNQNHGVIPANAGQIILANSKNMVIKETTIMSTSIAIELGFSSHNEILNNNIISNENGIYMYSSDNNNITNNNIQKNIVGISLELSNNNRIIENNISNNLGNGIYLGSSEANIIRSNNISSNKLYGIEIWSSNRNNISMNGLIENTDYGLAIRGSSYANKVHHNNFIANHFNETQGYDDGSNNLWNDTNEGNRWSDFDEPSENCFDTNSNGICDSPYLISGDAKAKDYYPLIRPNNPIQVIHLPLNPGISIIIILIIIIVFLYCKLKECKQMQ